MEKKYFSIHSVAALENKNPSGISWVRANCETTPERLELANKLFPAPDWWIEHHDHKKPTSILI